MADEKELPVSADLFLSYGRTNVVATTNSSRTSSSSNFNPLVTAIGFNPMVSGYPAATMAAFYSNPFSMLPYAVSAANCDAPNSATFLNSHGTMPNMLPAGFQQAANPWGGLMPPDYLLNIAAMQHLHQPNLVSANVDGNGETFNDILKKMPKPPMNPTANSNNYRNSGVNASFSHYFGIPTAAAMNPPFTASETASTCVNTKSRPTEAAKASKQSSLSTGSFSATSLAMSDQKPTSQSSASSTASERGGDLSHLHSSSLATLAEIASTLQNSDRRDGVTKDGEKALVNKEHKIHPTNGASSQTNGDHATRQKTAADSKETRDERTPTASVNGASVLDFSRKRPSSKMNGTDEDSGIHRKKEPKYEHVGSPVSTKAADRSSKESATRRDEKGNDNRQSRRKQESTDEHNAASSAATLFGTSLSSDLKMDPTLLNASAMAWAALSNQWLLANMQNEILNRAAAAAIQQRHAKTINETNSRQRSSSKSPAAAGSTSGRRTQEYQRSCRETKQGNSHPGSATVLASNLDPVDVTIDAVIRQHKESTSSFSGSGRQRRGRSALRTKRGRGCRGGITVREQLAARRGNECVSSAGASGLVNGCPVKLEVGSSKFDDHEETKAVRSTVPQTAALDLSVKSSANQMPASTSTTDIRDSRGTINRGLTNGTGTFRAAEEGSGSEQSSDSPFEDARFAKRRPLPDTNCYLNKNNINDIDRNNFSFSSKILVGEFLHVKPDGAKSGIVKLSEKEVVDLLTKGHPPNAYSGRAPLTRRGKPRCDVTKRPRRSGMSRRSGSSRRYAVQNRLTLASAASGWKNDSSSSQHLQLEQNHQGWETRRLDRERHCQLADDRGKKLDLLRNQKVMEAMQRAKEKDLRQRHMESMRKQERQHLHQIALLAHSEHEKVRQQLLFARVLDGRRRQDEKERVYAEKLIRREERLAARTATLMKLRQMRQPVEDMEIEETKELPALNRIENMGLDGQAFADLLMVMEFINNFGHVLRIDKAEIPNISDVQAGLLNDRRRVQSLRNLVKTLLLLVLEYPGLPGGNSGKTLLGQPAKDVGVTDMNMSELLRMFLLSRDEQGKELGNELSKEPFEALPPSRKAAILAFMCNELLYCRNVVREIEGNIEVIAKFKSDRWSLEGKLRHMKVIKASKRQAICEDVEKTASDAAPTNSGSSIVNCHVRAMKEEEDEDEEGDSSDSSDEKCDPDRQQSNDCSKIPPKTLFGITAGEIESISKEEKQMSIEEVDKELERLGKEMHDLRTRVNEVSSRVRASPFGQDRYNRYYWVLPHYAGVFIEGAESGAVNNPSVKLPPGSNTSVPRGSNHCAGPPKESDIRQCVLDIVEAVSRVTLKGNPDELDDVYEELKSDRLLAQVDDSVDSHKASSSTKSARIAGNKKMKAIPLDLQQGWWLIDEPCKLDAIRPCLHHRGIRERLLNRVLTKYGDSIKRSAFQAGKCALRLESATAPANCQPDVITLCAARRLLNMSRQLEEKVFQANVHVRGWKPIDTFEGSWSTPGDAGASSDSSCDSALDASDKYIFHNTDQLLSLVKERLLQLESNIERRYFMPAFNRDAIKLTPTMGNSPCTFQPFRLDKSEDSQLDGDSSRIFQSDDPSETDDDEDDVPLALERWRSGVSKASNIAQLSMCLEELDAQVAWEKSVMKASCQICRGGDDESQLLLCDGCDMGYHTYCFKPKLDTVPEGDWFCPQCIAKATRRPCCLLCCRQATRPMITCTHCSKNFHLDCLQSPAKKTRSGAWTCSGCCSNKRQAKSAGGTIDDSHPHPSTPSASSADANLPKKKAARKTAASISTSARASLDATGGSLDFHDLCSIMLAELDSHKDAGPFRLPVDTKGCPLYKKIIKQPMDLSTIRSKLSNRKYENETQFVNDVKLIFDNCRTFNEDDSPVGKSGHALRRYFNKRLKELKESSGKKLA